MGEIVHGVGALSSDEREAVMRLLLDRLIHGKDGPNVKRAIFRQYAKLHKQRDPETVRRMEKERGLA